MSNIYSYGNNVFDFSREDMGYQDLMEKFFQFRSPFGSSPVEFSSDEFVSTVPVPVPIPSVKGRPRKYKPEIEVPITKKGVGRGRKHKIVTPISKRRIERSPETVLTVNDTKYVFGKPLNEMQIKIMEIMIRLNRPLYTNELAKETNFAYSDRSLRACLSHSPQNYFKQEDKLWVLTQKSQKLLREVKM